MNDIFTPLFIVVLFHTGAFLIILFFLLTDRWRRSGERYPWLSRRRNRLEQVLITEVIAATVPQTNLVSLCKALGEKITKLLNCDSWSVWVEDDSAYRNLTASSKPEFLNDVELTNEGQEFLDWIRKNHEAAKLQKKFIEDVATGSFYTYLQQLIPGFYVPFYDGERIVGFILLGHRQGKRQISDQFIRLFGATAAILLKKIRQEEREQKLRMEQHRAEKLAALGKVAAGVAHEIRNPLTFIRSANERLRHLNPPDKSSTPIFEGIFEEIDRIDKHISELLSLGLSKQNKFVQLSLDDLLARAITIAQERARANDVTISFQKPGSVVMMMGDENQLKQLFLNLLLNSIEAMPSGGNIEVRMETNSTSAEVVIQDDGPGLPQDVRQHLFEPFITTKRRGTGLGLSLCYSAAQAHGGEITLKSSGPQGTSFRVELPVTADRPVKKAHG